MYITHARCGHWFYWNVFSFYLHIYGLLGKIQIYGLLPNQIGIAKPNRDCRIILIWTKNIYVCVFVCTMHFGIVLYENVWNYFKRYVIHYILKSHVQDKKGTMCMFRHHFVWNYRYGINFFVVTISLDIPVVVDGVTVVEQSEEWVGENVCIY